MRSEKDTSTDKKTGETDRSPTSTGASASFTWKEKVEIVAEDFVKLLSEGSGFDMTDGEQVYKDVMRLVEKASESKS